MIDASDIDLIASRVDMPALRSMRILMTGGTGFVGRWMRLACPNAVALDRQSYEAGAWQDEAWDLIVHLAMTGPERVMQNAAHFGTPIFFSSSGAVFDAHPGDYALGKIAAEQALLSSGLPVRIARMFTFCGGWMKNRYAVTGMVHDALTSAYLRVRSSRMDVTRSYLYAADMTIWLWRIVTDGQTGRIYEVGSPEPVTMYELAREVQRQVKLPTLLSHEPMLTTEPRAYYVPEQARDTMRELGLEVYTPFREAIGKTIDWYRRELEREAA